MRRFSPLILFIAIWLTVLAVPVLRYMLWTQVLPGPLYSGLACGPVPHGGWTLDLGQLASRFPHDVQIQALAIGVGAKRDDPWPKLAARLKSYDDLIRRYPNDPWLVELRLNKTQEWFVRGRSTNEYDALYYGMSLPAGTAQKVNFSTQDMHQALELARHGEAIDSDNAYFDWVLVDLLLDSNRDVEAFQALHRASIKPRLETYSWRTSEELIRAEEISLRRPLQAEEKAECISTDASLSGLRETARLLALDSINAEHARNDQLALQLDTDLVRLATTALRGCYTNIEVAYWTSIQSDAMGAHDLATLARPMGRRRRPSLLSLARDLNLYAAQCGRPDLAREVLREASAGQASYGQFKVAFAAGNIFLIDNALVHWPLACWWVCSLLLVQTALILPLWLLVQSLAESRKARDGLATGPSPHSTYACVGISAALGALPLISLLSDPVEATSAAFGLPPSPQAATLAFLALASCLCAAPLGCSVSVYLARRTRGEAISGDGQWPRWPGAALVMRLAQVVTLGTLWLLLCAWWCALLLAAGFVMGLRWDYLAQSLFAARNNTSSPDASNLLDCILKQLLGTPPYLPLCMLTLALAGILLRWWLVSRRPGGQEFLSRLVLLHTLLGGMLLSSAVLYLLVSVIALSPRQRMDAAVDSLVRHGEIGWKNHLTDP